MNAGSSFKKNYILHILSEKSGRISTELSQICDLAKKLGIKIITHRNEENWPLYNVHDITHQRLCLQIPEYTTQDISKACSHISNHVNQKKFGCVGIVLNQIQDPRNFGAILRSAAFFGVRFVIYGQNRQAQLSPLVLKTSAGGAFELDLIPVININRALEELKKSGAWVVGTANDRHASPLNNIAKDRVWIGVLGHEGTGLRHEVFKNCDTIVKIEGGTKSLDSLNVSVAAGVLMHVLRES